jgi:penicillin-binding protein 2
LNTAIGQGSLRVTVLQMALLYAAIGNGGKLWLPQIVERVEDPSGEVIEDFPPRLRREIGESPQSLAVVRRALLGVVNESEGTAYRARAGGVVVAGKTGTAQVGAERRTGAGSMAGEDQSDHAWFAGYAPADDPRIAFAVLVEHGGFGGEVAAPVAMEIVGGYFNGIQPLKREANQVSPAHAQKSGGHDKGERRGTQGGRSTASPRGVAPRPTDVD